MSDTTFRYVSLDLDQMHEPNTCTIRPCSNLDGSQRHWRLWAQVVDEIGADVGTIVMIGVGLNVGGSYIDGPDTLTKRWGFQKVGPGRWQVVPSIDVTDAWHHTPLVVDAPEPAPWESAP